MKTSIAISFGVIAEEKLPISLAWLSGVFESLKIDYIAIDFNYELYTNIDPDEYNAFRHDTLRSPSAAVMAVIDKTIKTIVDHGPDLLSISVFSYRQFYICRVFLERLNKINHSINISIGGPGVWYIPGGSNRTNGHALCVDRLVHSYTLGNAEEVIHDLFLGASPLTLHGVNTLEKLKANPTEEWTNLVKRIQEKYIKPSYKKIPIVDRSNQSKEIFVTGANGCPGKCAFCSIRTYIPYPSYRDGVAVADECYELFRQTAVTRFKRTDALANGHTKHFKAFNQRIIDLKNSDPNFEFEYNCMFVPKDKRLHDQHYYSLMAQAGCTSLDLGIESGSERLRKQMHKGYTNDQLDWHFEMCYQYGIKNNVSLFVGFPTETDADFEENLKMLDRYQQYVASNTFNEIQHCGKFVLYTNTYIHNNLSEYGVIITGPDQDPVEWTCVHNPSNTVVKRREREQQLINYAKQLGYKIDVYDSKDK